MASRDSAARFARITNVEEFFKIIKGNDHVYWRTVVHDGRYVSVNDFFDVSNPSTWQNGGSVDTGAEYDVNEALHLLNTVLSCEYCDALHYLVNLADKACDEIGLLDKNRNVYANAHLPTVLERYKSFRTRLYQWTLPTLESMVRTLVHVQNGTVDVPRAKGQDVLKVLLSWYAFAKNDVENDPPADVSAEALAERLRGLRSVHAQTVAYLERSNVEHCRRARDYDEFKQKVRNDMAYTTGAEDAVDAQVARIVDELKPIVYSPADRFALIADDSGPFDKVLRLIGDSMSSPPTMLWDGRKRSIEDVYRTAVANSVDTQTMLRFEHSLVHTITKILVRHVINELSVIVGLEAFDPNLDTKCYERVHSQLESYARTFEDHANQPSFLINNMAVLSRKLWLICHDLNDFHGVTTGVQRQVELLDQLAANVGVQNMNFAQFLDALCQTPVFAKLHPALTNVLWDKMFYSYSTVGDLTVDFKALSTKSTSVGINNRDRCSTVRSAMESVEFLEQRVDECELLVGRGSHAPVVDAVDALYALSERLWSHVLAAVERCSGDCGMWSLIMLTVETYQANVSQIKSQGSWLMMFDNRVRVLRHFHRDLRTSLQARDYVYRCDRERTMEKQYWQARDGVLESLGYGDLDEDELGDMTKHPVDDTLDVIDAFQDYFQSYGDYLHTLFVLEPVIGSDPQIRMLWDGAPRTMYEVLDAVKRYPFDRQDGYSFQMFAVKWMYAIVFGRIWDILGDMIVFGYKLQAYELNTLVKVLVHFCNNLPLYTYRAPSYDILRFTLIVQEFNGRNKNELLSFRRVIEDELRIFGVVLDTVPNMKGRISDRILLLVMLVKVLVQVYEESAKSTIMSAVDNMNFNQENVLFF